MLMLFLPWIVASGMVQSAMRPALVKVNRKPPVTPRKNDLA